MNPFAVPYACPKCKDFRYLARYASARQGDLVKCDKCGLMESDEYEAFKRDAWKANHRQPEICELDLTPDEFKVYEAARAQYPQVSKTTVLSWMEGQRYDPSKDQEFLAEAREKFKPWRAR